ncbi:MAG: FecR domain-containing protein [Candidatus Azobacteroides sp.]|nr:FecR domain-containing protein [Candidatus Azobacteroides sp.]
MEQNKDNIYRIDTDKAWNILRERLEKDHLLTGKIKDSPYRKRKMQLTRIAVAAAVCIGVIFTGLYFRQSKDDSPAVLQNKENSGTLVFTLDDGSMVYLAPRASISYPAVFAGNQRKVKLSGNALFSVAKDEKRPFVVETDEKITIEVTGTVFAVQSSSGNPFELSVKQGKVNVRSRNDRVTVPVEAGETVRFNTGGLSKSKTVNVQVFSRFTDTMCFKDEKLNNIVHAINTIYDSPTIIMEESLNNRTLTVTFDNNSVESMAKLICLALNLEQVNKQDTIYIRRPAK